MIMNERDNKISVIVIVRVELFFFSLLSITCPCFKLPGRNLPPFSKMGKFLPGRLIPIRYLKIVNKDNEKYLKS